MHRLPWNGFACYSCYAIGNHIFIRLRWGGELGFDHGLDGIGTLIRFICTYA